MPSEAVVDVLAETGIRRIDTEEMWAAAVFKARYTPALGDAFALVTAPTHLSYTHHDRGNRV